VKKGYLFLLHSASSLQSYSTFHSDNIGSLNSNRLSPHSFSLGEKKGVDPVKEAVPAKEKEQSNREED